MSRSVRAVLTLCIILYIGTTQYIITNYERINTKLQVTIDDMMDVCQDKTPESRSDLHEKYYEE